MTDDEQISNLMLQYQATQDDDVATQLHALLLPTLKVICGKWRVPGMAPEDVFQEIELHLFRQVIPSYVPAKCSGSLPFIRFTLYRKLTTILIRQVRAHRKMQPMPDQDREDMEFAAPEPPDPCMDPAEVKAKLDAVEDRLTPLELKVWKCMRWGENWYVAAARRLHLSLKSVDNASQRCIKKMRQSDRGIARLGRQQLYLAAAALRRKGLSHRAVAYRLGVRLSQVVRVVRNKGHLVRQISGGKTEYRVYRALRKLGPGRQYTAAARMCGCKAPTAWTAIRRLCHRSGGTWDHEKARIVDARGRKLRPKFF